MKAMAANAPGIPSTTCLLLTLGILLPVATLPTRLGVVILKRKHPQPQSDKQCDEPDKRGDHAESLFAHSHSDSAENIDKEVEEHGGEVKQQSELKELDARTEQGPEDILQ
jgi:hypothetical protein